MFLVQEHFRVQQEEAEQPEAKRRQRQTEMPIEDLAEVDLKGKKVLVRLDLNVHLNTDVIHNIEFFCNKGAKVLVCSHPAVPGAKPEETFSLENMWKPVAEEIGQLMNRNIKCAQECNFKEDSLKATVLAMIDGEVLLLENIRFHEGDAENWWTPKTGGLVDSELQEGMASLVDVFANVGRAKFLKEDRARGHLDS